MAGTIDYNETMTPEEKAMTPGMLVRILKAVPTMGGTSNKIVPYGLSPYSGHPLVGKHVGDVMGFEGGSGISVSGATEYYGKKGTMLRRKIRIDKRPWPTGQDNIRLRITVTYGHAIGNHGFGAPDNVYIRRWNRNKPFEEAFSSGTAPTDEFLELHGFGSGSATIRIVLEPRGVGPGNPLVWVDENPLSETYTHCNWSNPIFSQGVTYIAMVGPPFERDFYIDNPTWNAHHLNFSDGFVAVKYNGTDPLGLVMGVGATVECVGWDTGWYDVEGWHEGTTLDPYQIPGPNKYEYPNYPISDPFNPTGPGVG